MDMRSESGAAPRGAERDRDQVAGRIVRARGTLRRWGRGVEGGLPEAATLTRSGNLHRHRETSGEKRGAGVTAPGPGERQVYPKRMKQQPAEAVAGALTPNAPAGECRGAGWLLPIAYLPIAYQLPS